jgi:hypothetical protein
VFAQVTKLSFLRVAVRDDANIFKFKIHVDTC